MARTTINGPMVSTGKPAYPSNADNTESWLGNQEPEINEDNDGWANKADLADNIASRLSIPRKRAMRILDTILVAIGDLLLKRNKVAIKGFGTFESKTRKGRAYKHPMTGESVEVPDKGTVVFKPSKNLLTRVHEEDKKPNPELILK